MNAEDIKTLYYILGFMVFTNLGAIGTVIITGFRVVYNYAVLTTTVKALHERLDKLEGGDRDERKRR